MEDIAMRVTAFSYRRMPEALWRRVQKLIPKPRPHPKGGRPPLDPRRVADGIYFVLRTACPWKAAPEEFGSGSSLHRYFQAWQQHGVFRRLWKQGLVEYDRRKGIAWRWQTLDTAMTKAPLGGEKNRPQSHRSGQTGRQAVGAD
jgi:transposase